jgi:hypothetical protein
VDGVKVPGKSFDVSKRSVWEAWAKVKANRGAPGVDGASIEVFEQDLKDNLYKIWNRMSSGTYFPPPVRAVQIPKKGGVRVLGVPTVADRVAQTVVAKVIEVQAEKVFHPDSYGYRPGRSALDAVGVCRSRCWRYDWVLEFDIAKFFDTVPHDLVVKAVRSVCDVSWVVLYVKRWLVAPLALPDGTVAERDRGTPQGSAITPPTQLAFWAGVALRVGGVVVLAASGGAFSDGDAVPDGDRLGSDQDVFDQQSQDTLAVGDLGGVGAVMELGEEAFEVVGEFEVGVAVGQLCV